nr:zinc finger, CCHC-type [Tanacetum cinerariifolium]
MLPMSKDNLIPEFDTTLEKCNTFMLTKITRQPFKDIKRDSNVLELIHRDLCDFHATPSLGNKKYVVTFIDDASRFCYVYLCHAKDEASNKFKIYKTEVELQQNNLIKTIRTDRGGEYYDPVYFQSIGIIHETMGPCTPQQNGVSKRKNRALKEIVNSMLSYSGLNEGFWGEAMLKACYLLNRVSKKRDKVTPYELWTDQDQVDKMKEFLLSKFSIKDMGKADAILGIRIKHEDNGITITQLHYIEKIHKKFKWDDYCPVNTPLDLTIKLMPNIGRVVDQLEYSRAIGCLMYAMTSTRPDIAYAVGKLSRYTSNLSTHHWHAIMRYSST